MNGAGSDDASRESQLDHLLAEYLRRFDSGEAIDRGDFLSEHLEFAGELQELLETADLIGGMAGPLLVEEDAQTTRDGPAPEGRSALCKGDLPSGENLGLIWFRIPAEAASAVTGNPGVG